MKLIRKAHESWQEHRELRALFENARGLVFLSDERAKTVDELTENAEPLPDFDG